ncbi:MAG: hypothetical protein H7Y31_02855 [Chitinophagaceae bacterium]|nr:hypothetical protein [Chitinophagaceae bacterium]
MKKLYTTFLFVLTTLISIAQQSDFIQVKKHNNRTLKTYYTGAFISAETYDGFRINGIITAIRNDSVIFQQTMTSLVPTQLGQKIDTIRYSMSVYVYQIKKFNMEGYTPSMRKKGFSVITIPKLMIVGGVGFLGLELVNTIYRKESLTDGNKLGTLAIAVAVAGGGFLWNWVDKKRNQVGGKYKMVYVRAGQSPISR